MTQAREKIKFNTERKRDFKSKRCEGKKKIPWSEKAVKRTLHNKQETLKRFGNTPGSESISSDTTSKKGQLLTQSQRRKRNFELLRQKRVSTLHSISNTQQTGLPDEKEESIANADTKGKKPVTALSLKNWREWAEARNWTTSFRVRSETN